MISVYIASGGQTEVILPNFLRGYELELPLVGSILTAGGILKLGPLYYFYLFALIIFCLNSINILAGVNGLEGMSCLQLYPSILGSYYMNHIPWQIIQVYMTKTTKS